MDVRQRDPPRRVLAQPGSHRKEIFMTMLTPARSTGRGSAGGAPGPGPAAGRRLAGRFPDAAGWPHGGRGGRSGRCTGRLGRQRRGVDTVDRRGLGRVGAVIPAAVGGGGPWPSGTPASGRPARGDLHPQDRPWPAEAATANGGRALACPGRVVGRRRHWPLHPRPADRAVHDPRPAPPAVEPMIPIWLVPARRADSRPRPTRGNGLGHGS